MQIINTSPGVRAINSLNLKLRPGEIGTVKDEDWKAVKKKKVVAGWLESGELKELSASEANKRAEKSEKTDDGKSDPDKGAKK